MHPRPLHACVRAMRTGRVRAAMPVTEAEELPPQGERDSRAVQLPLSAVAWLVRARDTNLERRCCCAGRRGQMGVGRLLAFACVATREKCTHAVPRNEMRLQRMQLNCFWGGLRLAPDTRNLAILRVWLISLGATAPHDKRAFDIAPLLCRCWGARSLHTLVAGKDSSTDNGPFSFVARNSHAALPVCSPR